ncbi:MAG: winged helix-turn-helix domain-containing protein, partial [Phycisphaerae bacterium]
YHTSLDDLTVVTPRGLAGGYHVAKTCLYCLEHNRTWRNTVLCEPQLGKRGLYPTLGARTNVAQVALVRDLLAYCDGTRDLLAVADTIGQPMPACIEAVQRLQKEGLLEEVGCR